MRTGSERLAYCNRAGGPEPVWPDPILLDSNLRKASGCEEFYLPGRPHAQPGSHPADAKAWLPQRCNDGR
jgi:hypothetical protein